LSILLSFVDPVVHILRILLSLEEVNHGHAEIIFIELASNSFRAACWQCEDEVNDEELGVFIYLHCLLEVPVILLEDAQGLVVIYEGKLLKELEHTILFLLLFLPLLGEFGFQL
jgi:hypothetical protein